MASSLGGSPSRTSTSYRQWRFCATFTGTGAGEMMIARSRWYREPSQTQSPTPLREGSPFSTVVHRYFLELLTFGKTLFWMPYRYCILMLQFQAFQVLYIYLLWVVGYGLWVVGCDCHQFLETYLDYLALLLPNIVIMRTTCRQRFTQVLDMNVLVPNNAGLMK